MCQICNEIDDYIAHYRDIQRHITDPLTVDAINVLISKADERKRMLHPDEDDKSQS